MTTARLRIIHTAEAGWRVDFIADQKSVNFSGKSQAIWFAIAWASQNAPCEIDVYSENDKLERTITLPDGEQLRGDRTDRRRRSLDIAFPDRRRQQRRVYH